MDERPQKGPAAPPPAVLKPRRDDNQVGGNRRRDETDAPFSIGKSNPFQRV